MTKSGRQWTGTRVNLVRLVVLKSESEEEFAARLGISRTTLRCYVKKGDSPVPQSVWTALESLADKLQITEERLAMLDGSYRVERVAEAGPVQQANVTPFPNRTIDTSVQVSSTETTKPTDGLKKSALKETPMPTKAPRLDDYAAAIVAQDSNSIDAIGIFVWNVRSKSVLEVIPFIRGDLPPPIAIDSKSVIDLIARDAQEILDETSIGRPMLLNVKGLSFAVLQLDPLALGGQRKDRERGTVPMMAYFNFTSGTSGRLLVNAVHYNIELSKAYERSLGHTYDLTAEEISQRVHVNGSGS